MGARPPQFQLESPPPLSGAIRLPYDFVKRFGVVRTTIAFTLIVTIASGVASFAAIAITGEQPHQLWVAIAIPLVVPLVAAPPFLLALLTLLDRLRRAEVAHRARSAALRAEIAERTRTQETLQRIAITDDLTTVFKRRYFIEQLSREIARAREHDRTLSVIMVDADYFKAINDAFGHAAGDAALVKMAELLRLGLRTSDSVARLGGEEFAAMLPETREADAKRVAERLRDQFSRAAVPVASGIVRFTASFGVAGLSADASTVDAILRNADCALYQAKAAGRNCVVSFSELDESIRVATGALKDGAPSLKHDEVPKELALLPEPSASIATSDPIDRLDVVVHEFHKAVLRLGPGVTSVLLAFGGVLISVAASYAFYGFTSYDLTGRPVAIWAPFLVPLAVGIPLARPVVGLVIRVSLITDDLRRADASLARESRARQSLEEKLRLAAITDDLTNVYNRRHFFDVLKSEIARAVRYARPLSIAILDVDHFKHVNDRFGHAAGDGALRAVVETCRPLAEKAITIARYGGEEFVLLFPEADGRTAAARSDELRQAIAATAVRVRDDEIRLTASFGVASLASAEDTADRLLARADSALYDAKRAGRNRVIVATA